MHVLVSNDDGVDAPGIRQLSEALRQAGHRVTVVAPDRDRSGASNSLTLEQPIRGLRRDEHTWSVAGTPTDCVHLALSGMLDGDPDLVFSGINNSSNLGDDVIYSGTVAAAMEGRCLGLPAVAFSLARDEHKATHFDSAARAAVELLTRGLSVPGDVAVAGFDDLPIGNSFTIGVTSYAYPAEGMAEQAVRLARERRQDFTRPPIKVVVPGRLIVRESTAGATADA